MKQIKFTMTKPINLEHSNIADVKVSNPDADIRVFAGKEKKTENEEDISKIIYAGENILLPFGVKLNSPDVSDRLKLMGFNSIDEIKNIKKIDYDFDECGKSAAIKFKDNSSFEFMLYSDGGRHLIKKDADGNIIFEEETDKNGAVVFKQPAAQPAVQIENSNNNAVQRIPIAAEEPRSLNPAEEPNLTLESASVSEKTDSYGGKTEEIPDGRGGKITIERGSDGRKYFISGDEGRIYLDENEKPVLASVYTPGGSEIELGFKNGEIDTIKVSNADGTEPETIMDEPQTITGPDGGKIAVNQDLTQTVTGESNSIKLSSGGAFAGWRCDDGIKELEDFDFEAENPNPNFELNSDAAVWRRNGETILRLNGKIDESLRQGNTGDCWLLSPILALNSTEIGRKIIQDSIWQDKDGKITGIMRGAKKAFSISDTYLIARDPDQDPRAPRLGDALKNLGAKLFGIDARVSRLPFSTGDDDMLVFEAMFSEYFKLHPEENNKPSDKTNIEIGVSIDAFKALVPNAKIHQYEADSLTIDDFNNIFDQAFESNGGIIMTFNTAEGAEFSIPAVDGGMFEHKIPEFLGINLSNQPGHVFAAVNFEKDENGRRIITCIDPYNSDKKYRIDLEDFKKANIAVISTCDLIDAYKTEEPKKNTAGKPDSEFENVMPETKYEMLKRYWQKIDELSNKMNEYTEQMNSIVNVPGKERKWAELNEKYQETQLAYRKLLNAKVIIDSCPDPEPAVDPEFENVTPETKNEAWAKCTAKYNELMQLQISYSLQLANLQGNEYNIMLANIQEISIKLRNLEKTFAFIQSIQAPESVSSPAPGADPEPVLPPAPPEKGGDGGDDGGYRGGRNFRF